MLIIQELSFQDRRYNDLKRQLAGIGTNVLAERLKRLVENNILTKSVQGSQSVVYALGPRGRDLLPALAELRRWGTNEQLQLADRAPQAIVNDMSYSSYRSETKETYQWLIGETELVLEFEGSTLTQRLGKSPAASLVVKTDADFMRELMAGAITWEEGRFQGRVEVEGESSAWQRMILATAYPYLS